MANTPSNPGAFIPPGTVETVWAAPVVIVTAGVDFCRTKEVIPLSDVAGGTISLSQQVWSHSPKGGSITRRLIQAVRTAGLSSPVITGFPKS